MLSIEIPGSEILRLRHLVLDYNGTIAVDGELLTDAARRIQVLSDALDVHVITADTHGTVQQKVSSLACSLHLIGPGNQDLEKRDFVERLGGDSVVAIGNGRNDGLMLARAMLGIAVISREGGYVPSIRQADILCPDIESALDLLLKPDRLRATLRN